jgi:hypothetical protein
MVARRSMPTVVAVGTEDGDEIGKSFLDDPPSVRHLFLCCFSILVAHAGRFANAGRVSRC